jgi:predicted lipoprotein with Yx(FWY)xxD motif
LKVAANAKLKQQIIVDAAGKAVYAYVPDGASATSKVPKALASVWPALTTTAKNPMVGAGLAAGKLHLQMQPDGKQQVAYDGHLLYLFGGDRSRGVANGQALGNIWYVLSPTGTRVK